MRAPAPYHGAQDPGGTLHTLAHDLVLLALDDGTGRVLVDDSILLHYAVAGAFLAELQDRDRLVPARAHRFQLREGTRAPGALGAVEDRLAGRKPLKLDRCLSRVVGGWGFRGILSQVLEEQIEARALRREQERFWIIPWRTRHPTADPALEDDLRVRLRAYVDGLTAAVPPNRLDALLGLLRVCALLGQVWSEAELQRLKPVIDERTDRVPIGVEVRDLTRATHAAIAAAVS